jgi:hypothetical protein
MTKIIWAIKLTVDEHRQFAEQAAARGCTRADLLREWLQAAAAGQQSEQQP